MSVEVVGECKGVVDVALNAERESFDSKEELLGRERVECAPDVSEHVQSHFGGESDVAERLERMERERMDQ